MNEKALLLAGVAEKTSAERLEKILAVFGVPSERQTAAEFLAGSGSDQARLLCTAETFLEIAAVLEKNPDAAKKIHSAFVFAGNDPSALQKLAQAISGDELAKLVQTGKGTEWDVTDKLPEFCQSMSGLRVAVQNNGAALVFDGKKSGAEKIVFTSAGAAFVRFEFYGIPVFLSTAEVIDVTAPLAARDFDIRVHLLSALPVVLFVKWAFAEICWQPAETCACLIIDDPLLTPRYGFLDFEKLLGLMERLDFSTSIAFIPWNCERGSRKTTELFRNHKNRFSISIHGCDHTGGEYGDRDRDRLAWKSRQALQHMARHATRTGLPHDRVMVFPQGVFSEAAMSALKHGGFIGTVNSEVVSADPSPCMISVADYWGVALMNYSDFPIFTRRCPWLGVENFAFDILLGKPCLLCTHHNDFHDDGRHVEEFMARLVKLNAKLRWTNLAEVARRSFRQREISADAVAVEMFASEARVKNNSAQKKTFRICKRESASEAIQEIRVENQPVKWTAQENQICFETELNPGAQKTIVITFKALAVGNFSGESLGYRVKATVRRHLCEFRDNYVRQKTFSV